MNSQNLTSAGAALVIVTQLILATWWASQLDARVDNHVAIDGHPLLEERVKRLEKDMAEINFQLRTINTTLEKISKDVAQN